MLLVKTELKNSPIHGLGVFAKQFIPKGTLVQKFDTVFDFDIHEITIDELNEYQKEFIHHYGYKTKDSWYIICADNARFLNHSTAPNLDSWSQTDSDIALRDIEIGEELTVNYFSFDEESFRKLETE